jgi:hypothetical protein
MDNMSDLNNEEKIELYKSEFKRFDEAKIRDGKAFDYIILIVTTGSFALSVTYINGSNQYPLVDAWWLIVAWVCLLGALFVHAYGYWISVQTSQYTQNKLIEWKSNGLQGNGLSNKNPEKLKMDKKIQTSNIVTITLLSAGIISLVVFAAGSLLAHTYNPNLQNTTCCTCK